MDRRRKTDQLLTRHGIVTPATLEDARELDRNLREADRRELEDVTGRPALANLLLGVLISKPSLALRTHEGKLIAILNVAPVGLTYGVIGMSGTSLLEESRTAFLRGSLDVISQIEKDYDTLLNVCDARNPVHHRWLKWLGFKFIRKVDQYGANGIPVYEFARITQSV